MKIVIAKLRKKILDNLPLTEPEKFGPKGEELLQQQLKEIANKGKIEIIDPSFQ